jgi:hypothetical protein
MNRSDIPATRSAADLDSVTTRCVTAIKLSFVGAGRARGRRAATLYYYAQMSRARPASTVLLTVSKLELGNEPT